MVVALPKKLLVTLFRQFQPVSKLDGQYSMSHQKSAQHEEADEVNNGKVAATAKLLPRLIVRLWVAALPRKTGEHDLLPRLTCGTSVSMHAHICM